jgi:hypothetical protein
MKLFVLLVLLAITAYACLNISAITATLNKGLFAFESVDADNLQGKPLVVFALPHGHCKASFPGPSRTPSAISFSAIVCMRPFSPERTAFWPTRSKSITSVNSDYRRCQFRLQAVTVAPIEYKKALWGSSTSATPAGNNSLVSSSNFNSEPLQIQNSLDAFSASWLADRGAILDSKVPIALKGGLFSGREITAHSKDGKTSYKLRFYCNYHKKKMADSWCRG